MRLNREVLGRLPDGIDGPGYSPSEHGVGIVHLGIGAFHRCHMAVYTDQVLRDRGGDWRIMGVSLRSATIRDQLAPQDGLYTVIVKDGDGERARIVGSVADVLWAPENPVAVLELMARPDTKIISLTVTEKGYCHDPATGRLNFCHPDIVHDLAAPDAPKSAIGYIVHALDRRRKADAGSVTVLCCDNLPSNGKVVGGLVSELAERVDKALASWIDRNVRFPGTMVDRIVPAMEKSAVAAFSERTGIEDQGVLATEPFSQWVIEDNFAAGRPDWEEAGAMLVSDVEPFEDAKLRMLNGSHSALAYLGFLAGNEYVHQAMADNRIRAVVDHLMKEEAATSIDPPEGLDLDAYRLDLQRRFDNPALQHRTFQIAMDGSQKLPQRFLGTIRQQLKTGGSITACTLGVAAWMRFVMARDEHGRDFVLQDPMADRLTRSARENAASAEGLVTALLGYAEIFGSDIAENARFIDELRHWVSLILNDGVDAALDAFAETNDVAARKAVVS